MKEEGNKIRWYVPVGHYTATHHVNQSQQAEKVNASFLKSLTVYLAVGLIMRSIILEKLTVFCNVYKTEFKTVPKHESNNTDAPNPYCEGRISLAICAGLHTFVRIITEYLCFVRILKQMLFIHMENLNDR